MGFETIHIKEPEDLKNAISIVRDAIDNNYLRTIKTDSADSWDVQIYNGVYWPDYFHNFYVDNDGIEWEFFAETYHGGGGWFRPLTKK